MPLKITELPNEPILYCEVYAPYNPINDTNAMKDAAYALYERVRGPIYVISYSPTDVRLTFSQAVLGIKTATEGDKALNVLPITFYAVADVHNIAIKLIMEAIAKGMYKGMNVKLARDKEDAITMIHANKK
jgi:hypothetical protein